MIQKFEIIRRRKTLLEHETLHKIFDKVLVKSHCQSYWWIELYTTPDTYQSVFNLGEFVWLQTWYGSHIVHNGWPNIATLPKYPGQWDYHQKIVFDPSADWLTDWESEIFLLQITARTHTLKRMTTFGNVLLLILQTHYHWL